MLKRINVHPISKGRNYYRASYRSGEISIHTREDILEEIAKDVKWRYPTHDVIIYDKEKKICNLI